MKIYCVAGRYHPSAEAALAHAKEKGVPFNPSLDADELPRTAAGMCDYLNDILSELFTGERAPPVGTVAVDEAFEGLPITHQLTLTALALENARAEIVRLKEQHPLSARDQRVAMAVINTGGISVEEEAEDFI